MVPNYPQSHNNFEGSSPTTTTSNDSLVLSNHCTRLHHREKTCLHPKSLPRRTSSTLRVCLRDYSSSLVIIVCGSNLHSLRSFPQEHPPQRARDRGHSLGCIIHRLLGTSFAWSRGARTPRSPRARAVVDSSPTLTPSNTDHRLLPRRKSVREAAPEGIGYKVEDRLALLSGKQNPWVPI